MSVKGLGGGVCDRRFPVRGGTRAGPPSDPPAGSPADARAHPHVGGPAGRQAGNWAGASMPIIQMYPRRPRPVGREVRVIRPAYHARPLSYLGG